MTKTLFILIRDALYSFVLAPALILYVFVMLAASDGSLSRQFRTTFYHLTEGAPAGKVMGCVNENAAGSFSPPKPGESLKPVPPALKKAPPEVLCQHGLVDSDSWAREFDATLRIFWMMAVMLGFGVWVVLRSLLWTSQRRISSNTHSVLEPKNKEQHE